MQKNTIKKPVLALLASAAIIASGSLTAYAAWHYLNPSQVAKEAGDSLLTKAFHSNDAVAINKSQTYGNYKITLEGMISGESISSQLPEIDGKLQSNRTYAVVAIQKKDGSPIPTPGDSKTSFENDTFTISPFIQGQPMNQINVYSMNGGVFTCIKDGVQYKLLDCDNLEVFADQEVYLGLTNTKDLDQAAYTMDEKTGVISRIEDYQGVNALFTLPFDKKKADTKKAEEQLKSWLEPITDNDYKITYGTDSTASSKYGNISDWNVERIQKECTYLEEFTKNVKPDKEGQVHFTWEHENAGSDGTSNIADLFKNKKAGTTLILSSSASEERAYFELATKEKDGSYTIKLYHTK